MAIARRARLAGLLFLFEVLFVILFAAFVRYDPNANARYHPWKVVSGKKTASGIAGKTTPVPTIIVVQLSTLSPGIVIVKNATIATGQPSNYSSRPSESTPEPSSESTTNAKPEDNGLQGGQPEPPSHGTFRKINVADYYPMFQDVHVMIFIGFGFLMTFLKRYGFGSVGLNFLLAAFVLQWAILVSGFLHLEDGKIFINIKSLLGADFAAAAILITFGALLGKASPLQMIIVAFIEIVLFAANEYIGVKYFKAVDVGGSMFVHAFGAYFGLAVARVIYTKDIEESSKEGSNYQSDLFSMLGTIFLWVYWPSFNAALAPGDDQHRAVINTYLSLAACCVVTFAVSAVVNKNGKIDMVHIQNSTLAGGVAIGTSADMMVEPWGALLVGTVSGILSVIGFTYITPFMNTRLKIHDTCGVNNLHGMPALLAGITGAIVAAMASVNNYGYSLYEVFPAMAPSNSTELVKIQSLLPGVEAGDGRSAGVQAGYQMLALVVTCAIAIVGGVITGFVLKIPIFNKPTGHNLFEDDPYFQLPSDDTGDVSSYPLTESPNKYVIRTENEKEGIKNID